MTPEEAARPVQQWLGSLPYKLRRELAEHFQEEAEDLAAAIEVRAPKKEGILAASVKVRRGRRSLDLVVTAGGPETTKQLQRAVGYQREITIGQGDNAGAQRGQQGVTYDYALGTEFGNEHVPAQPFFYNTAREREAGFRQRTDEKVREILSKA